VHLVTFTDKLEGICVGGTAVFPLPFEVENDVYSMSTTLDAKTEAVALFVVPNMVADMKIQKTFHYDLTGMGENDDDSFVEQFDK
jgi:hypothetical protein